MKRRVEGKGRRLSPGAWSWALYDWANSAFVLTVATVFFGPLFQTYWYEGPPERALFWLGASVTVSSLLVAVLAPVLGALAESGPVKRRYLGAFMLLGVLGTLALAVVPAGQWELAFAVRLVAGLGFFGSLVFYDALLPSVSRPDNRHVTSGLGFSLGYLGSLLLFAAQFAVVQHPEWLGLEGRAEAVRLSFVTVAVWWLVFSIPVLWLVKETPGAKGPERFTEALRTTGRDLARVWRAVRGNRPLLLFLMAYLFYIDGTNTLTQMAVGFGTRLGIAQADLMGAILLVQLVGVPCAVVLGWLGQRYSPRMLIAGCIGVYLAVTMFAARLSPVPLNLFGWEVHEFYVMAFAIGLVQGGLQALSRSYFVSLLPEADQTAYFGLYNMLGKGGAIAGPILMSGVGLMVADPRWGALAVAALFLVGLGLLTRVPGRAAGSGR